MCDDYISFARDMSRDKGKQMFVATTIVRKDSMDKAIIDNKVVSAYEISLDYELENKTRECSRNKQNWKGTQVCAVCAFMD